MACNNTVKEIITWPIRAVIIFNSRCPSLSGYISALIPAFFCKDAVVPASGGFWVPNGLRKGQTQLLLNSLKLVEVLRGELIEMPINEHKVT